MNNQEFDFYIGEIVTNHYPSLIGRGVVVKLYPNDPTYGVQLLTGECKGRTVVFHTSFLRHLSPLEQLAEASR